MNILILALRVTFPLHFANVYELFIMDDWKKNEDHNTRSTHPSHFDIEHHKIVRLKVSEPEIKRIEIDAIMVN